MSSCGPRISAVALSAGCTLLFAACGSSSHSIASAQAGSDQAASLVKFSECMRSHGVSGFPDPSTGGQSPNSFGIDGYNFNLPAGMDTQSPAYESATKTCQPLVAGGNGQHMSPAFVVRAKRAALAHAQCMREHGVPDFPDPTISTSGGGISQGSDAGAVDPQSPAFQNAQKVCSKMPPN
jgi:hypothetical protein